MFPVYVQSSVELMIISTADVHVHVCMLLMYKNASNHSIVDTIGTISKGILISKVFLQINAFIEYPMSIHLQILEQVNDFTFYFPVQKKI